MTKTYHTIKDIISSRFKSKDNEDKPEETGLNNVAEELRKSQANIAEEVDKQKIITEQQGYSKQSSALQQHQYAQQQFIQQQMLAQQQYHQQLKSQHQHSQLVQARSQEMLAPRADEQIYYQGGYAGTPQRGAGRFMPVTNRENNVSLQQLQVSDFKSRQLIKLLSFINV